MKINDNVLFFENNEAEIRIRKGRIVGAVPFESAVGKFAYLIESQHTQYWRLADQIFKSVEEIQAIVKDSVIE